MPPVHSDVANIPSLRQCRTHTGRRSRAAGVYVITCVYAVAKGALSGHAARTTTAGKVRGTCYSLSQADAFDAGGVNHVHEFVLYARFLVRVTPSRTK